MAGVLSLKTPSNGLVTLTPTDTATNIDITVPAVNGTLNTSGAVNVVPAGTAAAPAITTTGDTNTGIFFPAADTIAFTEGGVESMRIASNGSVAIGTSATPAKVTVATTSSDGGPAVWGTGQFVVSPGATVNSTGFGISVDTSTDTTYISSLSPGIAWRTLGYRAGQHIFYRTGTTEAARINTSGEFLVGTTSGGYKFVLQGTSAIAGFKVTNTGSIVDFYANTSTYVGAITTNGSSVAYNTTSDYRLKENVAPMQNALATVSALKPCTYTWKTDGSAGQGFIAHELQAIVPDCVTGDKDDVDAEGNPKYQGVDTSFLVATLVSAIQELTARLEALENK